MHRDQNLILTEQDISKSIKRKLDLDDESLEQNPKKRKTNQSNLIVNIPRRSLRLKEKNNIVHDSSDDISDESSNSSSINSDEELIDYLDNCNDDILELIDDESLGQLPDKEKMRYLKKIESLKSYQIPSIKEILDLGIHPTYIKELIMLKRDLDNHHIFSTQYSNRCLKFLNRMDYFLKNPLDKQDIIEKTEQMIISHTNTDSYREKILTSTFNNDIKSLMYQRYLSISDTEEGEKNKKWIDTVLKLPTCPKELDINQNFDNNQNMSILIRKLMDQFDQRIYGMDDAKEEFICMIANMIINPASKHKAIGLYGPPGIGKTMIVRIVSEILNLPMEQISLGGISDSSYLKGFDMTYIGSEPGQIVKAISRMKHTNGIIFFDELDKISKTHRGKEIEHTLLHITDFTQNNDFRDTYLSEIPIDLSNYIFIYSMNSVEDLDSTLADRIPIIKFDGYNNKEKVEIIIKHIFPEILKNYNLNSNQIIFPRSIVEFFVNNIKEDNQDQAKSGVRNIKIALNRMISRINLYRLASIDGKLDIKLSFHIPNFQIPYIITENLINMITTTSVQSDTNNSYIQMYS